MLNESLHTHGSSSSRGSKVHGSSSRGNKVIVVEEGSKEVSSSRGRE
jgi:hypothetical protein